MPPKQVLLTGSAGRIGTSLRRHLTAAFSFRCLDIKPTPEADDAFIADITSFNEVLTAMRGVRAVVHLAGNPAMNASWETVRDQNIVGTYNVFEAARQCGVRKLIFASSNHVTGFYESDGSVGRKGAEPGYAGVPRSLIRVVCAPAWPVRPDTLYGVSKAFGEALGRFYADAFGLAVICLRIGSFLDTPVGASPQSRGRVRGTWCSPRDLAQLVRLALTNDDVRFGIFYGVSGNPRRPWDITNAQELLGYQPQDNAEFHWEGDA